MVPKEEAQNIVFTPGQSKEQISENMAGPSFGLGNFRENSLIIQDVRNVDFTVAVL